MALRTLAVLAALGAAAALGAPTALADPPARRLRFEQVLGLASELPSLAAVRDAARAERELELPRPWSPLSITLTPQRRFAPQGDRGMEGVIAIQQAFPLSGLADARRAQVSASAALRDADATTRLLEARLDAAAAWIDGWAARERLATATRELELARELLAATERGASRGVFTQPELADARAYVAETELQLRDAEGRVADTGFALAMALAQPGPIESDGDLPGVPLPASASWNELVARARALPAVAARQLAARAARARATEERASRGMELVLGGEVYRDGPGALAAGLTVGVTLPHDRGTREAHAAELEARLAEADGATLAMRSASELSRALHEVEHTGRVLDTIQARLVPAAIDAATRRQRAFDVGETTIVELLAARRTAVAAEARLADAQAAHAWARMRAWLLLEATKTGEAR